MFDAVDERFDLIVFDPPFRWFAPRSTLEAATTDENYGALTRFFAQADHHLEPEGGCWSSSAAQATCPTCDG